MTKEDKFVNSDGKPKAEQVPRDRSSRQRMQKKDKVKPLTKVIIRHLPPTMSEEEFLKQIDPLPEHDFYYYAAADWSLGYDATCRAYLNFKNYEDVFLFRDRFDGYVFVDSNGAEYIAIVEFAPFQGLAKNKSRKTDPKVNSIELEQHYKSFLEKLQEDREAAAKGGGESKLEFTLDRKKEEKITSTPLLQYLANKKEKRREESKKRTEEKRRQREQEKERRQRNQQHVTKIMSSQETGGGAKKENGSKSGGVGGSKENGNETNEHGANEEGKNSRSKRRAARDQRRREEYEQRKRERERLEREQREKGVGGKGSEASREKQENQSGTSKKHDKENKPNDTKTDNSNRKDVKKYSERRERDRKRNRKEQEQRQAPKDEPALVTTKSIAEVDSSPVVKPDTEVSDSVKNFIRSVAAVKEFVPKHKQKDAEQNKSTLNNAESNTDSKTETQPSKELDKQQTPENLDKTINDSAEQPKMESAAFLEEQQMHRQRLAEERRIRNKDRPSIAIYQPKPRLRLSEEGDSKDVIVKDTRSNPTSDCESLKKEEQHQTVKKPSRYSERRSERRSRDKRKDSITSEGNADSKPEFKNSKSQEENSDKSEKIEVKEEVTNV